MQSAPAPREVFYCYFLESHLKDINNVEVHKNDDKCLKSLKKLLEKEFQDKNKQIFIINVYVLELKVSEVKKKDIKQSNEGQFIISKLELKVGKNKFEGPINKKINSDFFVSYVKFEFKKKLLEKKSEPPTQFRLSFLEIMQVFTEALTVVEKRDIINDVTYRELINYGYFSLIKRLKKVDLVLFLMVYIDALNQLNFKLIRIFFESFDMGILVKPSNSILLSKYHENLHLLFNDQIKIFD